MPEEAPEDVEPALEENPPENMNDAADAEENVEENENVQQETEESVPNEEVGLENEENAVEIAAENAEEEVVAEDAAPDEPQEVISSINFDPETGEVRQRGGADMVPPSEPVTEGDVTDTGKIKKYLILLFNSIEFCLS